MATKVVTRCQYLSAAVLEVFHLSPTVLFVNLAGLLLHGDGLWLIVLSRWFTVDASYEEVRGLLFRFGLVKARLRALALTKETFGLISKTTKAQTLNPRNSGKLLRDERGTTSPEGTREIKVALRITCQRVSCDVKRLQLAVLRQKDAVLQTQLVLH